MKFKIIIYSKDCCVGIRVIFIDEKFVCESRPKSFRSSNGFLIKSDCYPEIKRQHILFVWGKGQDGHPGRSKDKVYFNFDSKIQMDIWVKALKLTLNEWGKSNKWELDIWPED